MPKGPCGREELQTFQEYLAAQDPPFQIKVFCNLVKKPLFTGQQKADDDHVLCLLKAKGKVKMSNNDPKGENGPKRKEIMVPKREKEGKMGNNGPKREGKEGNNGPKREKGKMSNNGPKRKGK